MNRASILLFILVSFSFTTCVAADQWHATIVPDKTSVDLDVEPKKLIVSAFQTNFTQADIAITLPEALFGECDKAICAFSSVNELTNNIVKTYPQINVVILFEISHFTKGVRRKTSLKVQAIDPISGDISFTNMSSTPYYDLNFGPETSNTTASERTYVDLPALSELADSLSRRLAMQISNVRKRYVYKLTLSDFTPEEIDVFTGIALSSVDNVKARLINETTTFHFFNLLLPSKEVSFELSTLVSPGQFREQTSSLFKRMNVEVASKYIPQENIFKINRSFSPYSVELFLLWGLVIALLLVASILAFWSWVQFRLNLYESRNQSSKWLALVSTIKLIPIPFLCREKWKKQMIFWDKRVVQANVWFENARQLLHVHEIESANTFVKKTLEIDASHIGAKALENAIEEQLSKHHVIENEREQFKGLVSKAVQMAQSGDLYKALEQAYLALELSQSLARHNRPIFDLQIDSTNNLIKRIVRNKGIKCAGIKLFSNAQRIHINCGEMMRIGRSQANMDYEQNLNMTFPQDTLSRLQKSIVITRQKNGFSAEDLGSTNGLWLQYHLCDIQKEYILSEMDQLHLSPPDELGSVGFQVNHLESNKSLSLRLCQNAILPSANMSSSKSFINPSEYALDSWYLSNESFYLVFSLEHYIWYSASEWETKKSQLGSDEHCDEVLKIDLQNEVWLHLSSRLYDVKIDDSRIIGPVPLGLNNQLSVNGFQINIKLVPQRNFDSSVVEMLHD